MVESFFVGNLEIKIYWLSMMIGVIISFILLFLLSRPSNSPRFIVLLKFSLFLISLYIIGSKVTSLLEYIILHGTFEFSINQMNGHGRWFGAFVCLVIVYIVVDHFYSAKGLVILDALSLSTCLGLIFGKLGCFFSGHYGCHGIETSLPWGVTYPFGINLEVSVHPVQLYDAIFFFVLFILLINKRSTTLHTSYKFLLASSIYGILIGFIRSEQSLFYDLKLSQIFYITSLIILHLKITEKSY